jgi:predicted RNase H-like nuclease
VTEQALKPFSDPDFAREAGLKSAEMRKLRDGTPEDRAQQAIQRKLGRLTSELLAAALGEGDFADLKASDRLKALQTALAYGLGRPGSAKPTDTAPEAPSASTLFGLPAPE